MMFLPAWLRRDDVARRAIVVNKPQGNSLAGHLALRVRVASSASASGTAETINWAAGMAACRGEAALPLGSQIVSI